MIIIKRLIDCKGAEQFGSCHSCCKSADQDKKMVRITISTYLGQGTSICLCNDCFNELINLSKNFERNGDCETCKRYREAYDEAHEHCIKCDGTWFYEPYIPKENK